MHVGASCQQLVHHDQVSIPRCYLQRFIDLVTTNTTTYSSTTSSTTSSTYSSYSYSSSS
jgi:hypothetical protein